MKKRLTSYTFDASLKTVTSASFSDVTLAGIQLIVNVTDQIVIYNFADTSKGGTLATDTLTLEYDTTSMSDTDELMVLVEDGSATHAISGTVDLGATDNAVLDAIAASVAAIDTDTSTIIGHVDGIEGLLTTIDADTGTIATEVAGLLTDTELRAAPVVVDLGANNDVTVTGTVDLGATDNAVLDAIAASVAAIDTDTTTLIGHVDGLETSNSAIQTAAELLDDTVVADDAAFTPATTKVQMAGFTFDDAAPDSVNEGDAGAARMSANRNIYTTVRDAAGNERGQNVDANGNAGVVLAAETTKVIGTIRVASGGIASGAIASGAIASGAVASGAIASGAIAAGAIAAGATSIATTEDTASAAADHLVKVAQIRLDTPVANANVSNSGDYTQFIADNLGKTWTADNQSEDAAHASGDRGSFVLGVRNDTPNVALTNTDADYSPITTNKLGSLRVAIPEDDLATAATNHVKKYYTNSGAVTDGIIWSPAAGKRWFVTDIFIQVSAAATVTLEDDLAAGDAAIWKAELAANSGWSHSFNTPWFSGEDAADLLITTTAGNVYVTVTGYEI